MACYLLTMWIANVHLRSTIIPLVGCGVGNLVRVADILGSLRLIGEHQALGWPFSGLTVNHFSDGRTKYIVHCGFQLNHSSSSFLRFLREQAEYSS